MDFDETVKRSHANIRRKIARCKESGDLKRLLGLRDQPGHVRQNIDVINRILGRPAGIARHEEGEPYFAGLMGTSSSWKAYYQSNRCLIVLTAFLRSLPL